MNEKLIIGGIVLLLVIGGGLFLLLGGTKTITISNPEESGSNTTPTQWSQADDYKIEETAEGTVVTNQKAGFSFKVPEGWEREDRVGEVPGEYVFSMLSPDAAFQKDEFGSEVAILGGCVLNFETEYQKSTIESVLIDIASIERSPSDTQKILEIDGYTALQTNFFPPPSNYLETFGETMTTVVPLRDELVIRFATRYLPKDKTECTQIFSEFASNISIER